jgi:hypothetical protein
MHAKADRRFQSWLYLNAVATNVVACHEQDYDAFAACPAWESAFLIQGEEVGRTEGICSSGMATVNKCHAMELAIKG